MLSQRGSLKLSASVNSISATYRSIRLYFSYHSNLIGSSFCSRHRKNRHLIAAGLESGVVQLLECKDDGQPTLMTSLPRNYSHTLGVSTLAFRPRQPETDESLVEVS